MTEYKCADCGMGVAGLACSHCHSPLEPRKIKGHDGKEIQVAECPKNCGKIKSPVCCGHDMEIV